MRGNVDTRLRKRTERGLDAIILAACGLDRLDLGDEIGFRIGPTRCRPSRARASSCCRCAPARSRSWRAPTTPTAPSRSHAERAVTRALAGGCTVPVAAHAERIGDGRWRLLAYADRDGVISLEQADGADPLALADDVLSECR